MIDAHVHLWDLAVRDQPWIPAASPIRRTFDLGDLRAVLAGTPVERVVLVQAINDAGETADLLAVADDDVVAGVVGWADLSEPAVPDALALLRAAGPLVGIRHQALAEADPSAWLASPAVLRGLAALERAALPFDLMLRPEHLAAAVAVVRAHPSLVFVLDHVGKPPIATGPLEPWASALREVAAEPNVVCKLSGLQTVAAPDWTPADLAPFLDTALDAFGPGRLLFGSDWPVSAQAASYRQVVEGAEQACRLLSTAERCASPRLERSPRLSAAVKGSTSAASDPYHAHHHHRPTAGVIVVDQLSADDEREIRTSLRKITSKYPDEYWMRHDLDHEFAWDFYNEMAESGWIGICIPEEYGGGGAGVQEAALLLEEVTGSGGALNAGTTVQVALFGLEPIVKHGSQEQKERFLRPAAEGKLQVSFGVTEPDAGTETTAITTFAEKVPGGYRVNGRKVFISRAEQAERLLLITRTAPRDASPKQTDGMTLFFPKMDPDHIKIQPIPKLGRNAVSTNMLFIDDLFIPDEDRIGEEGKGFKYLLAGLNAERIIVAGGCLGMGRAALRRATEYVKQRHVFGRPIGMNQGVQFPLADSLAKLDAVELLIRKAAWMYDNGIPCGKEANEAKYLASSWAFEAADRAMQVHGGYGYTSEYHVERYWRESRVQRIAPISNELVLAYLGEKVLGLPRSY